MGYDLHMVRTPETVDALELPNSGGRPGYYRFNVWGMRMTVGALEWAAAIHHGERPEVPTFASMGIDEARGYLAIHALRGGEAPGQPPTPEELAAVQAFLRAHEAAVSASSLVDGRVGAYKFASNEGWLVTPDECRVIASKLRASAELIAGEYFTDADIDEEAGRRWVLGFARFNEIAAEQGGYRVH